MSKVKKVNLSKSKAGPLPPNNVLTAGDEKLGSWLPIKMIPVFLGIITFILYANTLGGDFVMDDAIVITQNQYTEQGIKGLPGIWGKDTFFGFFKVEGKDQLVQGGRYRPLSLTMFAIEKEFFGSSPFMHHLIGILVYFLCCWLIFIWLRDILTDRFQLQLAILIAFFASLIFLVHPVHTEVVANIKGRDEVLAMLFGLLAGIFGNKALKEKKMSFAFIAGFSFLLALFSKENAIVFLILIPLAQWFFYNFKVSKIIAANWPLILFLGIYLIIRFSVLGLPKSGFASTELMNNPFLEFVNNTYVPVAWTTKLATACLALFKYLGLLIFPYPLTHDYYPHTFLLASFGTPGALLGMLVYLAMLIWSLIKLKEKNTIAYGILFYIIALFPMSNLAVTVGTLMSERFLFIPSLGFCLIISYLLIKYLSKKKINNSTYTFLILLFLLPGIWTVARNRVWKNNYIIFHNDIKYSPNSAKLNNSVGGITMDSALHVQDTAVKRQMLEEAEKYLEKAIALHPTYTDAYLLLGNTRFYAGKFDAAISAYGSLSKMDTTNKDAKKNLAIAYREKGKFAGERQGNLALALENLNISYGLNPNDAETLRLLGVAHGVQGKIPEAITYFEKARGINPNDANTLFDLGNAYLQTGQVSKGQQLRAEAVKINPELQARLNQ